MENAGPVVHRHAVLGLRRPRSLRLELERRQPRLSVCVLRRRGVRAGHEVLEQPFRCAVRSERFSVHQALRLVVG